MDKKISRRMLLSMAAPLSTGLLAGCNQQTSSDNQTTSTETPQPDTQTVTQTEQPTATPDPLTVTDITIEEDRITYGRSLSVILKIENNGETQLQRTLPLTIGGKQVETVQLTLAPGEEVTKELTATPDETGTQAVKIGNYESGTVTVSAPTPDTVRDVGAHYYPWYGAPLHDWRDGEWSRESPSTPVLGNYRSTDDDVIEQHIDWCRQAGISWLNVSWWGPYDEHDTRFQEDILRHPRADELSWSVLYETVGRLGNDPVALDEDPAKEQFVNDLDYLAEKYFDRDNYKRIDNRPVLYIWVGQLLRGDVESAYQAAVDSTGVNPYLIVDMPVGSALTRQPVLEIADAITTYGLYNPSNPTKEAFIQTAQSTYQSWYRAAEHLDIDLIPTAAPGLDDTEITHVERNNDPVPSSPEIYTQTGKAARHYADGPVLVTSFNEWYEDTAIEPSEEHGTAYLDVTAETIAGADRDPPVFEDDIFTLQFEQTTPESEMNPQVESGRDLTFMLHRLLIEDQDGTTVLDTNIGTRPGEVEFIFGSYGPEESDSSSWQWLGGSRETAISVPSLPDRGRITLTGRGSADMPVSLEIDNEQVGMTTVTDEYNDYLIEY